MLQYLGNRLTLTPFVTQSLVQVGQMITALALHPSPFSAFQVFFACNIEKLGERGHRDEADSAQYSYFTTIFILSLQLIARMTKHGWFDGDKKVFVFRDILDEAGKFLRVSN